jgi:hypothetical protein
MSKPSMKLRETTNRSHRDAPVAQPNPRRPAWSEALTIPLARRVPVGARPAALVTIKLIHTAAFFSVAGLIALFDWDAVRRQPRRRTAIAAMVALTEAATFASNNLVCPLTPLAEELGAARGSVTDIFLPAWLSERIPLISSIALIAGLVLTGRDWRRRWPTSHGPRR